MNESVYCYSRLFLCLSVTFVNHVQTDCRRNPILCIEAHLFIYFMLNAGSLEKNISTMRTYAETCSMGRTNWLHIYAVFIPS
jgi:hypothetical protein